MTEQRDLTAEEYVQAFMGLTNGDAVPPWRGYSGWAAPLMALMTLEFERIRAALPEVESE